jgi:hypothetical protein
MRPLLHSLLAVAILMSTVLQVVARSDNSSFTALTMGTHTCGAWLEQRARPVSGRNQVYEGWVLGFLTAANLLNDSDTDLLKHIDGQSALAWIDNFCRANPLDRLDTATARLMHELIERAKHE